MELKNCRLIPELSDNVEFEFADIEIEDRKIKAVRPASGTPLKPGDIDCSGMTVIPGLMDLHVHLVCDEVTNDTYHALKLYQQYAPLLKNYFEVGITTVRDCGSTMDLAIHLRDGVNEGQIDGPRILSSGRIISPEAMRNSSQIGVHVIANGVDEVVKAARMEFANGADFCKIYATQSMSQVRGTDPKCIYSPEEIRAFVAVAEQNNSYVSAHAHSTDAIISCCKCGVKSIEHATYLTDEAVKLLAETPGAYIVPTHAVSDPYFEGEGYNDPIARQFWDNPIMQASNKRSRDWKNKAYIGGVKFGHGTDLDVYSLNKFPHEMKIKKEWCGISNVDILLQATKNCAEIAQLENITGQVKEGLCADLVGVKGNPDIDISVMYKKPALVIKDGDVKINRI